MSGRGWKLVALSGPALNRILEWLRLVAGIHGGFLGAPMAYTGTP